MPNTSNAGRPNAQSFFNDLICKLRLAVGQSLNPSKSYLESQYLQNKAVENTLR
jgi:hypothetical protein